MDEQLDEWLDRWMNGLLDEWMDEWMDGWMIFGGSPLQTQAMILIDGQCVAHQHQLASALGNSGGTEAAVESGREAAP